MKLEDEIQQKTFQNVMQKLSVNLIYTGNWLMSKSECTLKPHGITLQQFNILRILRGQYPTPVTILLIRERMLDKSPDVSRLVDRLVAKGLVLRHTCPNDRRKMDVSISDKGLTLLKELDKHIANSEKTLFVHITEAEAKTLNHLLDKLRG
jgi:DNA-binding MarR family transcriptional regulator